MIRIFDLVLLLLVSAGFGARHLFLGVVILTIGLFFQFQIIRTRLLVGGEEKVVPLSRKLKAALAAVIFGALSAPFLFEGVAAKVASERSGSAEMALPVLIASGILAAVLMVAISVEKRNR